MELTAIWKRITNHSGLSVAPAICSDHWHRNLSHFIFAWLPISALGFFMGKDPPCESSTCKKLTQHQASWSKCAGFLKPLHVSMRRWVSSICSFGVLWLGKIGFLMFLEQGSENFSFKGPDSKYFSFVDHMVSVVAIQQLLLLEHKSRNRQYVNKLSMTVFHSKFTKIDRKLD